MGEIIALILLLMAVVFLYTFRHDSSATKKDMDAIKSSLDDLIREIDREIERTK